MEAHEYVKRIELFRKVCSSDGVVVLATTSDRSYMCTLQPSGSRYYIVQGVFATGGVMTDRYYKVDAGDMKKLLLMLEEKFGSYNELVKRLEAEKSK